MVDPTTSFHLIGFPDLLATPYDPLEPGNSIDLVGERA